MTLKILSKSLPQWGKGCNFADDLKFHKSKVLFTRVFEPMYVAHG